MPKKYHPVTIPGCDLRGEALGAALADLRYDEFLLVLQGYVKRTREQAFADRDHPTNPKPQLSEALFDAVDRVSPLALRIERAWRISKPHMEAELRSEKDGQLLRRQDLPFDKQARYAVGLADTMIKRIR